MDGEKATVDQFAEEFVTSDYSGPGAVGHGLRRAKIGEPSIVYPKLKIEEAVELQRLKDRSGNGEMTADGWQRYCDLQNKATGQPGQRLSR